MVFPHKSMRCGVYITLFLLFPTHSGAVDFVQCLADVTSCATNPTGQSCVFNISNATALSVLRNSNGSPINTVTDLNFTDTATALSYAGCVEYCGKGQESFSWFVFLQNYSSWLLPYLALLSQLPFGARRATENLMSALLTLGSPTLAGYSLFVTLLNSRWLNDELFASINYPSSSVRRAVVCVLSNLQQVPVRIHPGSPARFESLVVHPDNDDWWFTLAEELDYSRTWSIATAISITWVTIAYLLTVGESFFDIRNPGASGRGTGSVWLWLLPIVMGWLVLSPKCDFKRVQGAYEKANKHVFVPDPLDPNKTIPVTFDFGLTITPSPDWDSSDRRVSSPDELRIPPVFNYARTLWWFRTAYATSLFYRTAWRNLNNRVGVDGKPIPENMQNDVPRASRLGSGDDIIRYCQPHRDRLHVLFPRGLLFNMIVASLLSLLLQWGTTSSAFIAAWYSPTVGLGCRSLAYLLYGGISTAVWFLLISSNAIGYYTNHLISDLPTPSSESDRPNTPLFSRPTPTEEDRSGLSEGDIPMKQINASVIDAEEGMAPRTTSDPSASTTTLQHVPARWIRVSTLLSVADWMRWIGKTLAVINAIGLITNSVFEYALVYDNCYCNSSVFTWGNYAFNVINYNANDINLATSAWIGALALALVSCMLFVSAIFLLRVPVPS